MHSYTLAALPDNGKTLILCANSRLAQSLTAAYNQARVSNGEQRWSTLDTRTVGSWLGSLTEEMHLREQGPEHAAETLLQRKLLTGFQERLLWEKAIKASLQEHEQTLFDAPAMAAVAAEAHALATEWHLPIADDYASDESRQFKDWQARFLSLCNKLGCIDSTTQQHALVEALSAADVPLPDRVLFAGYLAFTPLELALQNMLAERGIGLGLIDFSLPTESIRAASYPDADSECLAAALWAQDKLALDPAARLGIVVPDMAANRDRIQDKLDDILAPQSIRSSLSESPRPFNISLGRALNRHTIVSTALDLLNVVANPHLIEQAALGQLLRSPFWSEAKSEADIRAVLESKIRESVAPKSSLNRLSNFIAQRLEKENRTAPALQGHLQAMQEATVGFKKSRLPSAWSATLSATLAKVGWLSEAKLSSHAYQTRLAFLEELRKLAGLDHLLGEINASAALSNLGLLCSERVFQPKTEGNPPLQVLGLLEASGMQFDALWVMGMVDNVWPPAARPNPLLSALAQRTAGCPNASAAVQLNFAIRIHDQFCASATDITFSWPRSDGASSRRPSPLLADLLPGDEHGFPESPHWVVMACAASAQVLDKPFEDAIAPAVLDGEKVNGGTWLLRAQAICPAWAYFQYRLGASKLKQAIEGLDPAKRGSLVHDALEFFWTEMANSTRFMVLTENARKEAILQAVDKALNKFDLDVKHEPLKPRFRILERQRIGDLLSQWLEIEASRTLPFTVIANEREVTIEIEGIKAKMKIDRIDQLDDGRLLVIDYKTGANINYKNWASQRITEPQLPIYAAIEKPAEGTVAAVVFAKVRLEEAAFAGVGETVDLLPKLTALESKPGRKLFPEASFPDWASVLQHWDTRIRAIALEVKTGDARICFEDEASLTHCEVKPLLRLAERNAQMTAAASVETDAT